jgi:hypothetical protein
MRMNKTKNNNFHNRNNNRCWYCGKQIFHSGNNPGGRQINAADIATIDHQIPQSKGGKGMGLCNKVSSCRSCNEEKGALNVEEYRILKESISGMEVLFYGERTSLLTNDQAFYDWLRKHPQIEQSYPASTKEFGMIKSAFKAGRTSALRRQG